MLLPKLKFQQSESVAGLLSLLWSQDWITDLKFAAMTPLGNCPAGCQVHEGFYGAYESLRDEMIAALTKINAKSIIITGHSLGAAIACLAAYDVVRILLTGQ